ncbi:formylglycine-generating enzyme family protein [Treponema succinifaciens]|uniref:formylglycine-generating enzyme family protein n=1 Tax=Treponema succinifaciens TaxID=167 RepID=UPI003FCE8BC7
MKNLKKCFGLAGGRKSGLSFATFAICAIILLAVPLQISCSDSGDDNGDSNPRETKPDPVKAALAEGVTYENVGKLMIAVPGKEFSILATEVTQELYESVMGENPSKFNGEKNLPVEQVSWYDAVYFCNKLSAKCGLTPVYAVAGETDVGKWGYAPHKKEKITGTVSQNENASGYRLPTMKEWQYAAKGGQNYNYSGSGNLDEVGWHRENSGSKTHPVAQKDPNGYGLYDMSGNVWEWCWDSSISNSDSDRRYNCGGSWSNFASYCEVGYEHWNRADSPNNFLGFRIVCSTGK